MMPEGGDEVVLCLSMRETVDGPDLQTVQILVDRDDYERIEAPMPPVSAFDKVAARAWLDDKDALQAFLDRVERRKEALARMEERLSVALRALYPKRPR